MKSFGKLLYVLITLFLLSIAGGCGGGGSSDANGTLTLAVTAPSGATTTGLATATYTNPQGKSALGLEINFSTDRPDIIALDSTKASVGSSGQAQTTFRTITPGSDTPVKIIATTGGLTSFQQFTVAGTTTGGTPTPPPTGVTINPQSISFVSATPTSITLKGTGGAGRVETSIVTFLIKGTDGLPLAGQTVDFALSTLVGGLTITPASQVSGATGLVSTIVNAGVVSTPVRVTATIRSAPSITTQSDQLTVTTGLPDFDSFSMSSVTLNSETWNVDGVVVPVTVRLADHFNNPVPDGTVVNFTTNAGSIAGSGTSSNGAVTVNWTGQNPRIFTNPPGATRSMIGRLKILAYAIGEESFTDVNGNGLADPGEFTDQPEAFRDDNGNGVRDPSEPFIDFNVDGVYNTGDGKYNGLLQGPAFLGAPRTLHVFDNFEMVMCTDAPIIYIFNDTTANVDAFILAKLTGSLTPPAVPTPLTSITDATAMDILVTDGNGNTMAAGTTISVATDFGKLAGTTTTTVGNNIGYGHFLSTSIGVGSATPKAGVGTLSITVTNAKGSKYVLAIPISATF